MLIFISTKKEAIKAVSNAFSLTELLEPLLSDTHNKLDPKGNHSLLGIESVIICSLRMVK